MYTNAGNKILEIVEDSFEGQIDFVNQSFNYRPYCESGAEDVSLICVAVPYRTLFWCRCIKSAVMTCMSA